MAVYKSVKGVGKTKSSLYIILKYVGSQNEKEKDDRVYKTTGINVSDDYKKAFKEMMLTKELHCKLDGRQYRHHIQSFKPGEVDEETAHKMAVEFAEKNFKGFDVFISTHIDKGHIHNHIIINTVNIDTGMKFRELNKNEYNQKKENNVELKSHEFYLEDLKKSSDEICLANNLSVIPQKEKAESQNIYNRREYNVVMNKTSYKMELAKDIKRASKNCKSKEDFIKALDEKGVIVDWEDHKKHITFKFKDEKKKSIRLANLEKTFQDETFKKEYLEQQFLINQKTEEIGNFKIKVNTETEKTNEEKYQELLNKKREQDKLIAEEKLKKQKEEIEKKKNLNRNKGFGIGD